MLLKQRLGAQASRSVEEQAEIFIGLEPAETDCDAEPKAVVVRISKGGSMITFLLWCILLVVCWPLALLALLLYPLIWLLLLPFRIVGIAVGGVLELVKAIIFLPARVLRGRA